MNDWLGNDNVLHLKSQFFTIVFPSGVSTDSGWNWMPWMSNLRCFNAMTCPSGLMAVMAKSSGKFSVETTQE